MPPFNYRDLEGIFQALMLYQEKMFLMFSKLLFHFLSYLMARCKIMEPVIPLVASSENNENYGKPIYINAVSADTLCSMWSHRTTHCQLLI